eukprot:3902259-Rhodomonas_salina.4
MSRMWSRDWLQGSSKGSRRRKAGRRGGRKRGRPGCTLERLRLAVTDGRKGSKHARHIRFAVSAALSGTLFELGLEMKVAFSHFAADRLLGSSTVVGVAIFCPHLKPSVLNPQAKHQSLSLKPPPSLPQA